MTLTQAICAYYIFITCWDFEGKLIKKINGEPIFIDSKNIVERAALEPLLTIMH